MSYHLIMRKICLFIGLAVLATAINSCSLAHVAPTPEPTVKTTSPVFPGESTTCPTSLIEARVDGGREHYLANCLGVLYLRSAPTLTVRPGQRIQFESSMSLAFAGRLRLDDGKIASIAGDIVTAKTPGTTILRLTSGMLCEGNSERSLPTARCEMVRIVVK
jgi:hypothetical protein